MKNFKDYDKKEIFDKIDKISVEKNEVNQVITKFDGRVINITNVSDRYEIFDIAKYLKDKIELIENNFSISKYYLRITNGRQYLQLVSEDVDINGVKFYKSFYIVNSTDKSRRLSFNAGLHSDKFYLVGNNIGLSKKHLTGVNQAAEEATEGLNGETFDEQIKAIQSIVGHRVLFSKIRETIIGDKKEIPQINHRKFDAFKNSLRWSKLNLTDDQRHFLLTPSEKMKTVESDFYVDAFWTLSAYMVIFNRQDAHIIKNETERIMNITQWAVRNNVLEQLGI